MTIHGVFSPHRSDSLTIFFMLPKGARLVANAAFYGYLFWLCVVFLRRTHGKERVLVAGYCPGVLLAPIQTLVSPFAAIAIQCIKATGIAVAFVAALLILFERLRPLAAPSDSSVLG